MEIAEIPRSTYYDLVKKMNRLDPDEELKAEIQSIYNMMVDMAIGVYVMN